MFYIAPPCVENMLREADVWKQSSIIQSQCGFPLCCAWKLLWCLVILPCSTLIKLFWCTSLYFDCHLSVYPVWVTGCIFGIKKTKKTNISWSGKAIRMCNEFLTTGIKHESRVYWNALVSFVQTQFLFAPGQRRPKNFPTLSQPSHRFSLSG